MFLRFCKAAMQVDLPKRFVTDHSSAQCLHVTKLPLWFAQVRNVQNISKSALHRLICIIASFLGIKL